MKLVLHDQKHVTVAILRKRMCFCEAPLVGAKTGSCCASLRAYACNTLCWLLQLLPAESGVLKHGNDT